MTNFVHDDLDVPNGKVDSRPSTLPANQVYTAAEWNRVCAALVDLRDETLEGNFHGLTAVNADVSVSGKARLRYWNGTLQASINGGAYRGIVPPKGIKTNEELGILTTNTHEQNRAAWIAAMAARAGVPEKWLFSAGTYLFDTDASPLIVEGGSLVIEGAAGIDQTWFRVGGGAVGGILFRSYGDPPGTYLRADYSSIRGIKIDGDSTGAGIECNCPVLMSDCFITAFDIGVKVYGSAEAGTQASECHFERVFSNGNETVGFYFDGPDANDCLVSNCTASDNGVGGFLDSSFLGNTFLKCHAEVNGQYSYKTDDSNARALFLGCYAEAGQTCEVQHPSQFIGGIQGGSAAAFTGSAITYYEDEVRGRPLKFPYVNAAETASGFVSMGGGSESFFSQFHTAEPTGAEDFYSVWDPGGGTNWAKNISHYLWGTNTGVGAFGATGAASRNAVTGTLARYPSLIAENGLYLGNNFHDAWNSYDDYSGGPLAFALDRYGSGFTLSMGDRFFPRYQDKTQSGIGQTTAYAQWVCTKRGTLGTYGDGRTLTGDGTTTAILSGANTSLKVGQWILINGSSTRQITAISGLNVTFNGTVTNASGLTIAYSPPTLSAAGRITGTGQDDTAAPGAATQNTVSGRVAIAAGANSVTVTNSRVSSTSVVFPILQTLDATLTACPVVVCGSGTFTIYGNANATGAVNVGWRLEE